jgi:hypothetical protein
MNQALDEFSLMETVRDSAKFADKIDQLLAAKKNFEQSKKDADNAFNALNSEKTKIDGYVNGKKAELSAKQVEHDKAAAEAAARIKANNDQMAELLRVQERNAATFRDIAKASLALAQRERLMKEQQAGLADKLHEIEVGQDLIRRQQAYIAAMPKS